MDDYAIRAQFEAACPPADIRRWLISSDGIAGWWSDKVEGEAASPGGHFHVTFPTSPVVFDLEVVAAGDERVEWRIPESPPWWKGTTISFELSQEENGRTQIMFTHRGFSPDDPIIPVITPAWVRFLDNLVAVAEAGRPDPAVVN